MSRANFSWILIIAGAVVEIFWVSGLKHADTPLFYGLTILGVIFSFSSMIIACKHIEVSVAYAVFVGIGAGGVVLAEMLFFNEPFSAIKVSLIAVLILAVIGLKFSSKENDDKATSQISKELGIDEIEADINEFIGVQK